MGDLGVGDVGEDIGEPGLRIDIVELGGLDEGVGDRRGLAAAGRADEEIVLSSDRQGSDGALRGIVIGHAGFGASILPLLSRCHGKLAQRDRGVGVRRSGQAD